MMKGRRHRDTEWGVGGRPWEDGSRHWSDASTNQGMPRIAGIHQKLGDRHGTDPPEQPTLISYFWPPKL